MSRCRREFLATLARGACAGFVGIATTSCEQPGAEPDAIPEPQAVLGAEQAHPVLVRLRARILDRLMPGAAPIEVAHAALGLDRPTSRRHGLSILADSRARAAWGQDVPRSGTIAHRHAEFHPGQLLAYLLASSIVRVDDALEGGTVASVAARLLQRADDDVGHLLVLASHCIEQLQSSGDQLRDFAALADALVHRTVDQRLGADVCWGLHAAEGLGVLDHLLGLRWTASLSGAVRSWVSELLEPHFDSVRSRTPSFRPSRYGSFPPEQRASYLGHLLSTTARLRGSGHLRVPRSALGIAAAASLSDGAWDETREIAALGHACHGLERWFKLSEFSEGRR